jgi:site-specific recombinase XerD
MFAPSPGEQTIMQIEILFQAFADQGRYLRGWSPRTTAIYQVAVKRLSGFLAGQPDRQADGRESITKADLDAWVCQMRQQSLSPGGCNVNIRSINSFLAWLHSEAHLPEPLRCRLLPRRTDVLPTFSDAEMQGLLSYRPKSVYQMRAWLLVLTLLDTGIRIDEALGLEQSKVDLDSLQLRVVGKGNKERVVPFSMALRRHLYRFLSKSPGRFVFQTGRGDRLMYRNVYRDIKRVCELAGVSGSNVHPHAFRHFFAVNFIRQGQDIYRLSRILGHTSISTTQLYLRSMTAEQVGEGHCSPLTR